MNDMTLWEAATIRAYACLTNDYPMRLVMSAVFRLKDFNFPEIGLNEKIDNWYIEAQRTIDFALEKEGNDRPILTYTPEWGFQLEIQTDILPNQGIKLVDSKDVK